MVLRIKMRFREELLCMNSPFVWFGGTVFLLLSLLSKRICGSYPLLLRCSWPCVDLASSLYWLLFLLSSIACGMIFGRMFICRNRCMERIQTRVALMIMGMHTLTMFVYPLGSVGRAPLLAWLMLLLSIALGGGAACMAYRVSRLSFALLFVHFILLLRLFLRFSAVIFMN